MIKKLHVVLATLVLPMATHTALAQLVLNGSFENNSGDFSAIPTPVVPTEFGVLSGQNELFLVDPSATASNWTFGADAGIATGESAPDGSAVAWLNPGLAGSSARISQDLVFAVGSYNLGWASFAGPLAFETGYIYSVEVV